MGVSALQKYLEYAKNGGIISEEPYGSGIPESDFEIAVKEALESRGYRVDSQVGFSGFRIDLGVRHPDFPNQYILGIECDGATYHSHRTARDRDRLRQEVLTQLGWQIHRIWSTDWIRDPETAINLVIQRINDLRVRGESGVSIRKNPTKSNSGEGKSDLTSSATAGLKKYDMAKIPTYKQHIPEKRKPSEWLYLAEKSSKHRQGLFEDIMDIVNQEWPIHFQAICNRICEIYEFHKAGVHIQEIIQGILKDPIYGKHFIRRGDFIYTSTNRRVRPRAPQTGEKARPIEWVAIEELAAAAEWLLTEEFGMPPDVLLRETAHIMGYKHTGANVEDRVNKAIKLLLKEGKASKVDSQIVLKKLTSVS